jgi:hypothetical protein
MSCSRAHAAPLGHPIGAGRLGQGEVAAPSRPFSASAHPRTPGYPRLPDSLMAPLGHPPGGGRLASGSNRIKPVIHAKLWQKLRVKPLVAPWQLTMYLGRATQIGYCV